MFPTLLQVSVATQFGIDHSNLARTFTLSSHTLMWFWISVIVIKCDVSCIFQLRETVYICICVSYIITSQCGHTVWNWSLKLGTYIHFIIPHTDIVLNSIVRFESWVSSVIFVEYFTLARLGIMCFLPYYQWVWPHSLESTTQTWHIHSLCHPIH